MSKITFISHDGKETLLEKAGGNLMQAAVEHGIAGIEGDFLDDAVGLRG